MTTKKQVSKYSGPRPDRFSKKRSGTVAQTVRFSVQENKQIRKAATLQKMSISAWGAVTLLREADRILGPGKGESDGVVTAS